MTRSRLKTVSICQCFCFLALFLGLSCSSCLAEDSIAPDRNISLVQSEPETPGWKVLWDKARNLTRDKNYFRAAKTYAELIRIKPNIEEANWEYCRVLLKVEDYATATKIIGGLLDQDPNNSDYLLVGGDVAMHWKNYATAVRYYGRVYEKDPTGDHSDPALLGLGTSLRKEGKKELSFALLEQFSQRHPENLTILHHLAVDAHELGKDDKARKLFARLLKSPVEDDSIIFQAIEVFDVPGFEEKSNTLRLEYLKRHPDYMPFRKKLVEYYRHSGDFERELEQLIYLTAGKAYDDGYLLEAGRIYADELHRPDKALRFYERYRQKHPEDSKIAQKIIVLQSQLAKESLATVENIGAGQLWQDLAKITRDRRAVFLDMADLMEKKGQAKGVVEVLTVLYKDSAPDDRLALRIARQYERLDQQSMALKYLNSVRDEKNKNKAFYLQKGSIQEHLGLEVEALASLILGLKKNPQDLRLRTICLELAGKIGDVTTLQDLFTVRLQQKDEGVPADFVLTYMDLLAYNFLFHEEEKIYSWAKEQFAARPEVITRFKIHWASALRRAGQTRRAEQLLRQLLNSDYLIDDVLFLLAENALTDKNLSAAKSWYQALLQETGQQDSNFSLNSEGCRMLLLRVRILRAEEEYDTAEELINEYQSAVETIHPSARLQSLLLQLAKQQCWLRYYQGELTAAYRQCKELQPKGNFDPELWTLQRILARSLAEKKDEEVGGNRIYIKGNPVITNLLPLAGLEVEDRDFAVAEKHLEEVLKIFPDSVAGNSLMALLMIARGSGDSAARFLSRLIRRFPAEPFYHHKRIEVESRRGKYSVGLDLMKGAARVEDVEQLTEKLTGAGDVDNLLVLARLLWGAKEQKKALDIYRRLLAHPVLDEVSEKFRQKQINYHYLTRDDTFWTAIMLMLQSEPEALAELMTPSFLVDNRGNEAGKIVAGFFETYSWQKLISAEYKTRKAIYDRNYYYAEQSYKRLLEEDSSEGMIDLAAIYSKIGKYRKEAQVYEALQNSGTTTPELDESIERNSLQISPQSIFNAVYEEKNGRDGNIDLIKKSIGTSFWFTPALDKDIRIQYASNRFESSDTDETSGSNYLYGVATYEFSKAYELILGAGTEKLYDNSDTGYQYEIGLKGQLSDNVNGYVHLEKRQVYDTLAAIKQQVTFQAIETGLSLETPMGLSFGGDLHHRYYNDGNSQNKFHGYSSYTIFGDSLQLALRYEYQYLNNDDTNSRVSARARRLSDDEPLYWSPSSFNEHRFSLYFQHDFLGYEHESKKSMSYYAIDNAVSLEDNENLTFSTKIDIFLEMSPHFLLKGNFTLSKGDEYEEKGLSMSLHYRW